MFEELNCVPLSKRHKKCVNFHVFFDVVITLLFNTFPFPMEIIYILFNDAKAYVVRVALK